jgi:hypothetical protein
MAVGENAFTYSDQCKGERKLRIMHQWVERSASRPPPAPDAAIYPPDNGEANGTDIVFQWAAATDLGGQAIGDYHFELSQRPEMRWPLSMCFYKLVSRTADAVHQKGEAGGDDKIVPKAQYTLSQPGLLGPDRRYYWHVRAMDEKGVWGPWSKTWSFIARGPAQPVDVTLHYDPATGIGKLRWKANRIGRPPARYRVYGSDEKGFTTADQPYQGTVGVTKTEMAAWNPWFPGNFIAETPSAEMSVMGCGVDLPAANKAYYRVVAVDEQGKRSGPSDYACAPRPVIFSKPVVTAKVGTPYSYQVEAIHSLGDLSSRMKENDQVQGYFDIECPKFALEHGPAWLRIDERTGALCGTPDVAGDVEVAVTAHIDREVRHLDEKALSWGNEKLVLTSIERVGASTQRFVIAVQ